MYKNYTIRLDDEQPLMPSSLDFWWWLYFKLMAMIYIFLGLAFLDFIPQVFHKLIFENLQQRVSMLLLIKWCTIHRLCESRACDIQEARSIFS
ncbi:hypothetical protein Scep_022999 [Stephania cephalantha]|uniref:Uncharacterized protein n=1 Tax=Stephania cephalantha TaxID=152367 RepID=A0AAP0I2P5_9MAGN